MPRSRAERTALRLILGAFLLLGGLMALGAWRSRDVVESSSSVAAEPAWHHHQMARGGAVTPRPAPESSDSSEAGEPAAEPVSAPAPQPVAPPKPVVAPVVRLSAARGDCWAEVRRGSESGPVLFVGILASGQSKTFRGKRRLWLRLGAPQSVDAFIDGSKTELPSGTLNMVATRRGFSAAA